MPTPLTLIPETPYGNPIAPQWMFPDWGNSPWCESDFTYTFPLTIPVAGLQAHPLTFGRDSEFHVVQFFIYAVTQSAIDNAVEVRLVDDVGKRRVNAFVQVANLNSYVARDWVVAPGGTQRIDVRNLTGGSVNVWVVFKGRKRFQQQACAPVAPGFCQVDYVPTWARYSVAPPGFVDEPYIYQFVMWNITAPVNITVEGTPIPMDTDAPFLVRSVSVRNAVVPDGATTFAARLVDCYGDRLVLNVNPGLTSNPYALEACFAGQTLISSFARPMYPELVCPAGGVMALDLRVVATVGQTSGILYLNGVKRHRVG